MYSKIEFGNLKFKKYLTSLLYIVKATSNYNTMITNS